ncbi:hypothetical protein P4H82_27775 [Bacillus cereus]|nr:hypothetical protein [Bacillus cereus]MEB9190681.1 hypothetical protein [Bacillus cereus]
MKLTDKQCAVVLTRNWLWGGGIDPMCMNADEMSDYLDLEKVMTENRREKIIVQLGNLRATFEDKIENLYSKIEGMD